MYSGDRMLPVYGGTHASVYSNFLVVFYMNNDWQRATKNEKTVNKQPTSSPLSKKYICSKRVVNGKVNLVAQVF